MRSRPVVYPETTRGPLARSRVLDVARGLAILGVVVNHSLISLATAGVLEPSHWWLTLNDWMVIGRMPALCFLIGLFIPRGVAKRGTGGYLRHRLVYVTWIYFLWYMIQASAEVVTSPWKNVPVPASALWTIWEPLAHLWFLPMLALATIIVVLLRPWQRVWTLVPLVVVSILTWSWLPGVVGLEGLGNLAFVALGAFVGLDRMTQFLRRPRHVLVTASVALVVYLVFVSGRIVTVVQPLYPVEVDLGIRAVSLMAAVIGIPVLFGVAAGVGKVPAVGSLVAYLGRKTLTVYVAHIIALAGVRIVLLRLGVEDPVVLFMAMVAAGVTLPLLAERVGDQLRMSWLFQPPRSLMESAERGGRSLKGAPMP